MSTLRWSGTIAGIFGALWLALHLRNSGNGYLLFGLSSACWCIVGWRIRDKALLSLNAVWFAINCLGIIRWVL